jgi:uncharacterized protein (DUF302 family)
MKPTQLITVLMMLIASVSLQAQDKVKAEKFYFSTTVNENIEEATQSVKSALKEQGFSVITEINMSKTLKEKIDGADMMPYRILGACNAKYAWETIQKEENIGVFLPCKVILKQTSAQQTEVVAVNPAELMRMLQNEELNDIAEEVSTLFKKALQNL